jgi:pimeloyl-ACP methyl ester carboxylesterase
MPWAHSDDIELWYETFGEAGDDPLLMVNGMGSQCIAYRDAWVERWVAAGFFVIRFDNRGLGLSGPEHPAEAGYTLSDMARDAVAVLDAAGIERAHILGLSLGGMVVQTMAIEHPARVRTLTSAMSTTGDPDVGQSSDEARAHLLSPPATGRDEFIEGHLAGLRIWGSPGKVDEDEQREFAGRAYDRAFRPEGVAGQLHAVVGGGSRTAALGELRLPTLVIHGSADTLIDQSGGRRTAEAVPGARFVLVDGMGHDYPEPYWDLWISLVADHALDVD